jgi:WhiB family transcriptional regulator, redox-sensing transcriptional regulator
MQKRVIGVPAVPAAGPVSSGEGLDWRQRAACRDEDPDLFFPVSTFGVAGRVQVGQAKAVCRRCLVAGECLAWVLESGEDFGVWGGLDEVERRELTRVGSLRGRRVA